MKMGRKWLGLTAALASHSRTWKWKRVVHVRPVTPTMTREERGTVLQPGEVHQKGPQEICCAAGLQVEEVLMMDLAVGEMVQIH